MDHTHRKRGRPRKARPSDAPDTTPSNMPPHPAAAMSTGNASGTNDSMDVDPTGCPATVQPPGTPAYPGLRQPTSSNSPSTFITLSTNVANPSRGPEEIECRPRKRGRPRIRTSSLVHSAAATHVPAIVNPTSASHGEPASSSGRQKPTSSSQKGPSYRRTGRPRKAALTGIQANLPTQTAPQRRQASCQPNCPEPGNSKPAKVSTASRSNTGCCSTSASECQTACSPKGRLPGTQQQCVRATEPGTPRASIPENRAQECTVSALEHTSAASTSTERKYLTPWCFGGPTEVCEFCDAVVWKEEAVGEVSKNKHPKFNICCQKGKVKLTLLREPPEVLKTLLDPLGGPRSSEFRRLIRSYNTIFAFTSMGGRVDNAVNKGGAPYCFRLGGQNHHNIGSILPPLGKQPRFMQLYFHDSENELGNRVTSLSGAGESSLQGDIVENLSQMMYQHNDIAKFCKMARERIAEADLKPVHLRLRASRSKDDTNSSTDQLQTSLQP